MKEAYHHLLVNLIVLCNEIRYCTIFIIVSVLHVYSLPGQIKSNQTPLHAPFVNLDSTSISVPCLWYEFASFTGYIGLR